MASDAVVVLDAHTFEVVMANEVAHGLLSGDGQPLAGRPLVAVLPAFSRAALAELLSTARAGGKASEIPLRLTAGEAPLDVSATPFRSGDQQLLLVRARRDDTDDHHGMVPAMVRTLVETTPDAVVITDSAGRVQLANPAFVALVQQGNEARLKGRSLAELVDDRRGAWLDLIQRTRSQGLCARTALQLRVGQLELAVEASSTLLTEGEQEHVGLTVRMVEPRAAATGTAGLDPWPELSALRAQVGLVPLDTLLREARASVERHLMRTALHLAGGQLGAAARLLRIDPQLLAERLQPLGLMDPEGDDDSGLPSTPPALN